MDGQRRSPSKEEIELYSGVVQEARAKIEQRYSNKNELKTILRTAILATKAHISGKFKRSP